MDKQRIEDMIRIPSIHPEEIVGSAHCSARQPIVVVMISNDVVSFDFETPEFLHIEPSIGN